MALGLFSRISNFIICLFHQIGCCFRPKKNRLQEFRKQYKILDKIGGGGFGIVYQGYRIVDCLPVAVKFVRYRQVTNWTLNHGIILPKEIILLKICQDCEGVIRLVDWFSSKNGFIIIMERPKNFMDLFDLIKIAGRLNEKVANEIFSQIVRTIVDLYNRHSIIHRDVKDENIILDMDTGKTWLCDFGAAEFKDRVISKQFHGTKSYCPPEVFEIQRFLPLEGTVWSLGILLYTMLIGHPPFQNVMHICAGKIRIPGYISKECRSLIENCLQTDPKRRLRLQQMSSHEWLLKPRTDFIGGFSEMQKFWRRKGRLNSLGTARTTESESSEECSYRASTGRNEPEPITIPIRTPMASHCLSLESTCLRPDSGFDTCSEGPILRQSFNGSPSCPHTSTSSQSSSQNLFCSLCSSSYYTVEERFTSFDDNDSSRGSLISSAYFSTSSDGPTIFRGNYALDDEEGDITIIAEHPHKQNNRNGSKRWSKFEREISSDEDETIILNKVQI